MELRGFFVLIISQLFLGKIGSTSNQANDPSIENTVIFLQEKFKQMEDRMSSFELSLAVQDSQNGFMEAKIEILKNVTEVEMRCADVSARLQEAEDRFLKMNTILLTELQKEQERSIEAIERMHLAEQKVADMLESKTGKLQGKMNETREMLNSFVASQHDKENAIRESISSSTEKLWHLNDSLSCKFEVLSLKMRIFENTLLDIEKDYANISFVSKLDKSFQNLDKLVKSDIQSIQSERVKQLEVRCALCDDVTELNKTLSNHSSLISDLLDIHNVCADPPTVENGYPLLSNKTHLGRINGTTVTYECRDNWTLWGGGEIVCRDGEWTGDLPVCMNRCSMEDLEEYDGLDIRMNMITEHSESPSIQCLEGYIISNASITCLNGTWNVSDNPCVEVMCEDPPIVENGYSILSNKTDLGIKNGTTVTYACHGNRTLTGDRWDDRKIVCLNGEWTGPIPLCMNSCNTEDLKGYDGLDIPMNKITMHSESLIMGCREGYVLTSPYYPAELLSCLNGTWNVSNNPCVEASCEGEPPTAPNGKTMAFERKAGSKVLYECNQNYILTGNSTVRCVKGNWEGAPPVCSVRPVPATIPQHPRSTGFFDPTFSLVTWTNWDWYYCYSKDSYQKMNFSRELDTGLGRHLPGGLRQNVGTNYVLYQFGQNTYLRGGPFGAFQCGFSNDRGSMNIVMARQDVSSGLYFLDPYKVANIGDTVHLKVNYNKAYRIRWRRNGLDVASWNNREEVVIQSVQPTDAGTYEGYYEGRRGVDTPALSRLIVRKCKKNLFGENCNQQCPPCYNGGICHDHLGVCVCPPGFRGNNCENACGQNLHGPDCSRVCHYGECHTELFCNPDPYGCSCGAGRKGINCDQRCPSGWYGANCKQPCHCASGSQTCDIFTGACPGGCASGWSGPSCQIQR